MKPRLHALDKRLAAVTVILCAVGLAIVSSASTVLSYQRFGTNTYYFKRQLLAVAVGLVVMYVVSRIDYRLFKKFAPVFMLTALILLVVVLIESIGFQVGNSRRWINIGSFSFQPSEFAKLAVIVYVAAWMDARAQALPYFFSGVMGPLTVVACAAVLIIIEPDFGSMAALVLIAASLFFAGGARLKHLGIITAAAVALGALLIQAAPYRMERILTFLNPSSDLLGSGYQVQQAQLAIGSGGVWGVGFGESRQKFNFLPEPLGDSIFAIASEELGFIRVLLLLGLYTLFAYLGLQTARRAPENFGRLVATGVTMWVVLQATVNIGAMLKIMPLTGIPLPFISYGGSAMIALLAGVGIMLNISRHKV